MKQCITILLVPIHESVGRFRYSVFIYEENSWKSTFTLILRIHTCWSIVVIPSSYITMICWWFGAEISQWRYGILLCSVISALGFEPRNRRFGKAVARCWDGYGGCQFASVLSWVCKCDKQYISLELVWSWPSTIWHIAVFRWFPLLDLNHGIDDLEKL